MNQKGCAIICVAMTLTALVIAIAFVKIVESL
jgi:hypothetical protein